MPNIILHFDPYPPTNAINLYSVPRRSIVSTSRRTGILASFFHALNPNMHYDGPDEYVSTNVPVQIYTKKGLKCDIFIGEDAAVSLVRQFEFQWNSQIFLVIIISNSMLQKDNSDLQLAMGIFVVYVAVN